MKSSKARGFKKGETVYLKLKNKTVKLKIVSVRTTTAFRPRAPSKPKRKTRGSDKGYPFTPSNCPYWGGCSCNRHKDCMYA